MSGAATGPSDIAPSLGLGRGTGHRFGSGWISGFLAVTCGALGYGGVLCLLFPNWLTTPSARALSDGPGPIPHLRHARSRLRSGRAERRPASSQGPRLHRHRAGHGGTLLGGSTAQVGALGGTTAVGLDWFLLNLFILALVFIPLERAIPRLRDQTIFRQGWTTDLMHFAMSHLLVQVTVVLTMLPAGLFFRWATHPWLQDVVASQPLALQFVEIVLVADFTQYWVHRAFHHVPWLWRLHAIHHSSETLDWLAGSRLHLVDIVVTRGLSFVPLYVLGFAPGGLRVPRLRLVPRGLHPRQRAIRSDGA